MNWTFWKRTPVAPPKPVRPPRRAVLTVTSIRSSYNGGPPEVTLRDDSESSFMGGGYVSLPAVDGLACVRVGDEVILIPGTPAKTGC